MSNFSFLKDKWCNLAKIGTQAESYLYSDSNACMFKMRMFGEQLIDLILAGLRVDIPPYANQDEKIKLLRSLKINKAVPDSFDIVRRLGNKSVHNCYEDRNKALECLKCMFKLSAWVYVKITKDNSIMPLTYVVPSKQEKKVSKTYGLEDFEKEKEEFKESHEEQIEKVKEEVKQDIETEADKHIIENIENTLEFDEKKTRKRLIDIMLKDAGWDIKDANRVKIEYKLKDHIKKGKYGSADYVLFNDKGEPIAVIEAKKTAVDSIIGRTQAQNYANTIEKIHGIRPIIFYTNGYEIYIWDDDYSEPRQVWGFYTLSDLEELMFKHKYRKSLLKATIDKEIAGRPYQIEGIKKVFEAYESGKRNALLVMATGTGKTRTVIALTKAMMERKWVKRVLFLADRDELVKQAKEDKNSFKTFMPNELSIRFTGKNSDNRQATLYFSTYQAMINYYRNFSVGFFDLIICDESHRSIYQVYRDIIQYFDSYVIGLTATPVDFINRNTYNFFGCDHEHPTFDFSIDKAWDHMPPYLIEPTVKDCSTDFLRKGIKYNEMNEKQRDQIDEEGYLHEYIDFNKNELERKITNKDTNRYILKTLMDKGIRVGDYIGKTIIFARNKEHANLLDELFNEMYPQYKGKLSCVIYSKITNKSTLIESFKGEDMPRIAISVDLLDTGIDVPEIVNLVFAKPIFSKVKFWQMIGRGTRRCDNLFGEGKDKNEFLILDCWKNFEFFEINKKGHIPKAQKTSIQVRFELLCKLLDKFNKKNYSDKVDLCVKRIKQHIDELPEHSIEIKKNRKNIEKIKDKNIWLNVNDSLIKKLMLQIAPLTQWINCGNNSDAILFDNSIYKIIYAKILGDNDLKIKEINDTVKKLSRLKLTLNQFNSKRELIKSLLKPDGWENLDYDKLDDIRKNLRDLMKYKGDNNNSRIVIDVKDTGEVVKEINASSVLYENNVESYEKRVKKAIEERLNNYMIIHKIRLGKQLCEEELRIIEDIFKGDFIYSLDELSSQTDIDKEDIIGIIRKFIGVDEKELDDRFEEFRKKNNNKMKANQIATLDIIKGVIIKNKGISSASLFREPYTRFSKDGVDGIFGTLADDVFDLIKPFKTTYISQIN